MLHAVVILIAFLNGIDRFSHIVPFSLSLQCDAGLAAYHLFQALNTPPTKVMLLGCGCSIATEATAQVSYRFNLTQVNICQKNILLQRRQQLKLSYRFDLIHVYVSSYRLFHCERGQN